MVRFWGFYFLDKVFLSFFWQVINKVLSKKNILSVLNLSYSVYAIGQVFNSDYEKDCQLPISGLRLKKNSTVEPCYFFEKRM
tara:strand:- start:3128 stop:3373 length:246 start_codon:yes stop_codon:yes gene_type:complete